MYRDGLSDILDDGDFTDSWAARDFEGDGNSTPDAGAIMGALGMQPKPLMTPTFTPLTPLPAVTTTTTTGAATSRPSDEVQVGMAVRDGAPPPAEPPSDDPSLPLPEGAYRANGGVFVRDQQGGPIQIFPIAGQWQTRGGVLARYVTAYATARNAGQAPTQAVQTAAQQAGYYVPTTAELQAAGAVTNNQMAQIAGAINEQNVMVAGRVVGSLAPRLDALTAYAQQQAYSQQATAEHRDLMAAYEYRTGVRRSLDELLAISRGVASNLNTFGPKRY